MRASGFRLLRFASEPLTMIDAAAQTPFAEDGWIGATLQVGGVRMRVDRRDGRCVVVNVDPRYELAERVHVLVHELGHIRCNHESRREVSRAQRETEGESVAFIVCTVLGLQLGDASAVYVGGSSVPSLFNRSCVVCVVAAPVAALHAAAKDVAIWVGPWTPFSWRCAPAISAATESRPVWAARPGPATATPATPAMLV